jgi:hypothetical protein
MRSKLRTSRWTAWAGDTHPACRGWPANSDALRGLTAGLEIVRLTLNHHWNEEVTE